MNPIEIGQRLHFLRTAAGLSQSDIAYVLHVTRQSYCNYEHGKVQAPLSIYSELASIFHTSEIWIMTGMGSPDSPSADPYISLLHVCSSDDIRMLLQLFEPQNDKHREKVMDYIARYCH